MLFFDFMDLEHDTERLNQSFHGLRINDARIPLSERGGSTKSRRGVLMSVA
jgi:hypothetical protein